MKFLSQKTILIIILALVTLLCIPIIVSAHAGRTDSAGGHYVTSTGEYHYHHGYPAHQHIDGVCPYSANNDNEKANSPKLKPWVKELY